MSELPLLPPGFFLCTFRGIDTSIYLYKYLKTAGCRNTESSAHGRLALPIKSVNVTLPIPPQQRKGIGGMYFNSKYCGYRVLGKDDCEIHALDQGVRLRIEVEYSGTQTETECRKTEMQRTMGMHAAIGDRYKEEDLVCDMLTDNSQCCPFRGGGSFYWKEKVFSLSVYFHPAR